MKKIKKKERKTLSLKENSAFFVCCLKRKKKMFDPLIRLISLIVLIVFGYPLTYLLHPWWILIQPLGATDTFSTMIEELTEIMRLPEKLSLSIQTGQWWWNL